MKDQDKENKVITLHSLGWSVRRISRELDVSRKRVDRLLASNLRLRNATPKAVIEVKNRRQSKLDP